MNAMKYFLNVLVSLQHYDTQNSFEELFRLKKINLDTIELQCDNAYKEPFDLVLKTVDDTLVSIPVTQLDLEKLEKEIQEFLQELREKKS